MESGTRQYILGTFKASIIWVSYCNTIPLYKEAEYILETFLCIPLCIPGIDNERAIGAANITGPNTSKDSSQFRRSVLFILLTKGKELLIKMGILGPILP